jgi:hypothetical protein
MICASMVSAPTLAARTRSDPVVLTVERSRHRQLETYHPPGS